MFDQVFAFKVIHLVLLQFQPVSKGHYLEPAQEQSEQGLIEDLLVFGELVFHNGVDEEDNTLLVQVLLVAQVMVTGLSWACPTLTVWLRLEQLSGEDGLAKLSAGQVPN